MVESADLDRWQWKGQGRTALKAHREPRGAAQGGLEVVDARNANA